MSQNNNSEPKKLEKSNEKSPKKPYWIIVVILLIISIFINANKQTIKEKAFSLIPIHQYEYNESNFNMVHWYFTLNVTSIESFNTSQISPKSKNVEVPHTWNNLDGQDGGSNYFRTISAYQTQFKIDENIFSQKKRVFIEFGAVNSIGTVYLNGKYVGNHVGGFQIFRFDITDFIQQSDNILTVFADNRQSKSFYPQFADFTFFGGIYRPVKLIFKSSEAHFDMNDYGSKGIYVTPTILNKDKREGIVNIKPLVKVYNSNNEYSFKYIFYDQSHQKIKEIATKENDCNVTFDDFVAWNGRENPYLYSLEAQLIDRNGLVVDKSELIKFGFRSFACDHKGFYLNGKRMRLNGASRHQDRLNKGWAVSHSDEIEDIDLIMEVGANSVRFAHYQQSQGMFDLCDEKGLIVWVEIPFISMFLNTTESNENLKQIMKELIKQNYNHPCVAMWGLMNELGIGGESEELFSVLKELNSLAKSLDSTRMTTSAMFQGTQYNSTMNRITDIIGYNIYYGWYSGTVYDNDNAVDEIYNVKENPPLAITEYGAECNIKLHSEVPLQQDYSEEYQLFYHMNAYSIFESKDFLWGTYVWNMFDFAADSRNEGGVQGRNNKGLVTYDRKIRKDSFYYYKAKWNSASENPFVHICSKRFVERANSEINVTILSNLNNLNVYLNGDLIKSFNGDFSISSVVKVTLKDGVNKIKVTSNNIQDEAEFKKVTKENPTYSLPKNDADEVVYNHPDGFFSVYDTVGDLVKNEQVLELIKKFYGKPIPTSALLMVKSQKLTKIVKMAGASVFPPERVKEINDALNKIPKE